MRQSSCTTRSRYSKRIQRPSMLLLLVALQCSHALVSPTVSTTRTAAAWHRSLSPFALQASSSSSNEQHHPKAPSSPQHHREESKRARLARTMGGLRSQLQENVAIQQLQQENQQLVQALNQLQAENERLLHDRTIVLETFEGEAQLNQFYQDENNECNVLQEGACPLEPTVSFGQAFRDRALWLVGLLAMQSCSGFILAHNEALLANHPVIIYFLTMLVGAGGNAGNQASVRVIRGLALGTLSPETQRQFLTREFKMAGALAAVLSLAGFVRAIVFRTPLPETLAVTASLALIVFSSVCLGAVLPLVLKAIGVDPAHSSTSIQVVMDILGVMLAVVVSSFVLDSPLGAVLVNRLSLG